MGRVAVMATCLIWAAVWAAGAPDVPGAVLVRQGEVQACVVLDSNAQAENQAVAADFVRVMERMTGARLPEGQASGKLPIFVGEPAEFPGLPFAAPALAKEAFLLKVTPEGVYLLGGSPLGTQHAVYTLLRDVGCRWVMPGAIGECLPETKDIALPEQERIERPDFYYRDIWYAYGCGPEAAARHDEWFRRNRMHLPAIHHRHNLTNTLGRLAPFEQRPELYALRDGKRVKTQICTSNLEVLDLVAESIAQYVEEHPETESYSLCPDDNTDFCECAACTALDSGKMDRGGLPSIADRYQTFLNELFARLKDRHPELMLTTYSYNRNHTAPPVNVPVHQDTCIFATTSVFCSAHGIGDMDCASRQDFKQLLSEWAGLTNHICIYEYDPVPYSGGLPWPMWEAHGKEMPEYRKLGIMGISYEGQDSWASYFPNYYPAAQLMWDADQDAAAIFDDMLDHFFLEAAPAMRAYYAQLGACFHGVKKKAEWGLAEYTKYFTPEVVKACGATLAEAEAAATTPIVKQRIEMVRLSFEEMDAYVAMRTADNTTTYEAYKAILARLNGAIDQMEALNEDYLLARIAREKTLTGVADRYAREQGYMNQWLLCGPFDNPGLAAHDQALPPEHGIDLTAHYQGKRDAEIGWTPNQTPEWQGYVDLTREFNDTDAVCAYALCWVTNPGGPRDVMFRAGSNDSLKIFLNGQEIWSNKIERVAAADADLIPVTLPVGTSQILLKIGQTALNWGFYFRITERGAEAVPPGLSIATRPSKN
ncbi:MAG: DUF4838 domain-containing protein [Candidatus Hydrogenedentes bacterium]|nr:DUF4838 domain-containing protein [Candidatus Hydrogenedentota bacterium]